MKKVDYDRIIENEAKELIYKNLLAIYELKAKQKDYKKHAEILSNIIYKDIKYIRKKQYEEMNFYGDNK